jgi:hypothetical protein
LEFFETGYYIQLKTAGNRGNSCLTQNLKKALFAEFLKSYSKRQPDSVATVA